MLLTPQCRLDIIGRTVGTSANPVALLDWTAQSFDYDFGCGETAEAKDIWKRWDAFVSQNLTNAGSLVCVALHDGFGPTI